MFNYTRAEINEIAKEHNFISNTTEKVLRLYDILEYVNQSKYGNMLALKGGTAINLCLLNLPRLSVDIDFDFAKESSREEMLEYREQIRKMITGYMMDEGYALSDRSKFVHTLDSYVWSYDTLSKSRDVLKIEINYSERCHIINPILTASSGVLGKTIDVYRLADAELIGSKINALIVRTTPRDIYDVFNLKKAGLIVDTNLIKKIAIFYAVLGSDKPVVFDDIINEAYRKMSEINYNKVRETLLPVLHKGEKIIIEEVVMVVIDYLKNMFQLSKQEMEYIERYNHGEFVPALLFDELDINDISNHPMALWKVKK